MSQKEQTYVPGLHLQQDAMLAGHLTHICHHCPNTNSGSTTGPLHLLPTLWGSSLWISTWSASFLAVRSCLNCIHLREAFSVALSSKKSCPTLPGHHIIHFQQSNYHHWNHVYILVVYLSSLLNYQLSGIRDLIHLACHTLTTTQTNTGTEQLAEMFTVWLKILLPFPPLLLS